MRKLMFVVPAVALAVGGFGWKAEALTTPSVGVANQSLVQKAACFGPGRWCGWGRHRVCRRWHCWCAPCF